MSAESPERQQELSRQQQRDVDAVLDALRSVGVEEFVAYMRSPWRMLWTNFIAGVVRGFSALVGASLLLGLLLWVLKFFVSLPLIGAYANQVTHEIKQYAEESRYGDDFARLEHALWRIERQLGGGVRVPLKPGVESSE